MTHTVDSLMALAYKLRFAKSESYARILGEALRTALTEALGYSYVSLINEGNKAQPVREPLPAKWAEFLHYPGCWDMAAYPNLESAVHEALAFSGCSVCKPDTHPEASR